MSRLKLDVEFPCGYKLSLEAEGGLLTIPQIDNIEDKIKQCPLHGKNCKKGK